MTKILADEKVVLSEDTAEDDGLLHYVHEDCHNPDSPFVTSWCGIALDWAEKRPESEQEKLAECPGCIASARCPNCGRYKIPGIGRRR
jgi:hypothetical protein